MKDFRYDNPQFFEAFIKSAQYLVRLKTQQDVWEHLGKFIVTYFPATWTAFIERDPVKGISVHHCTLPEANVKESILTDEVRNQIDDVLQSGFLASQIIRAPYPSMTVFLPVVEEYKTGKVMLIGHKTTEPLSNDLLNIYLAIAGLAGTTFERLRSELELNGHRAHLEELVKERTVELAQAKRQNELILNSAGEGICGISPDGSITFVNPSAAKIIGWEQDELIGKNAHATFHHTRPDGCSYPVEECPVYSALKNGTTKYVTSEMFLRKDGTRFPVEFMTTSIMEEDSIVGAVVIFHDITERKQAEEAVIRAKEEWELTFNTVPDLMMILDKQHRLIRVNKAMADRLGLKPEQCIGLHCYEAVHGLPHPPKYCPHSMTCQDGIEHITDIHEPRLGGDFHVSTTPLLDGKGELFGSIHVARDITERKRAEDNLKFLEKSGELVTASLEYETILSSIPKLVVPAIADWCIVDIVDEDGSINLAALHHIDLAKVKWAYELRNAYPLSPNSPIGAPAVIRTGKPEIYPDITDAMLKSIAKNDEELRILRSAGYASIMIVPLKTPKQTHGCITLVSAESSRHFDDSDLMLATDLARKIAVAIENSKLYQYQLKAEEDIKRLNESLLQRAAELEASNKELEAFSYSVSHDLRAPLRHMDGFSRLVLEGYADKLDKGGKEYLQYIRSSSELMAKLIDDLLNLSRITRAEIHLEKVDLSELAREVSGELEKTRRDRHVEWIIAAGLEAYGDRQLLKLVFDNLLGNAVKFTGKLPRARIEFGVAEHNGEQVYFVRDNGAGFDMTYADKLFKPFQRLHRAEDFPGTGIGLASVHRIISRLGGKVRAEGETNKGATFYFTLGRGMSSE